MKTRMIRHQPLQEVLETIGERLQELRLKKGYSSHAHFAEDFGLPPIQYWRMEKGKANMNFKSLNKVLAIHRLTFSEFFGRVYVNGRKHDPVG
jgi:transcriptional regulator with XRE-family HTH domain